jgi:hypothetical protein
MNGHRFEQSHTQDLENCVETLGQPQAFLEDRDEDVDADGDPHLGLHRVGGRPVEGLDAQALLDPYLKALRRARSEMKSCVTRSVRSGDRHLRARPSAPEGGAQGRQGNAVAVSFSVLCLLSPVLRSLGNRCHRSHISAVSAAGWCPGGASQSLAERLALMDQPRWPLHGRRRMRLAVRFPFRQDPIGGFRQVARDRADRLRVPLPLLDPQIEATDVSLGSDPMAEADRIRGFDEGPQSRPHKIGQAGK